MTEVTLSSATSAALDELKERRPADRYEPNVLKELRFNGFITDVSGGWITISKRGLDYLYPPTSDKPAGTPPVSFPAKRELITDHALILKTLKAAGGIMSRRDLGAHGSTLKKLEKAGQILIDEDEDFVHLVTQQAAETPKRRSQPSKARTLPVQPPPAALQAATPEIEQAAEIVHVNLKVTGLEVEVEHQTDDAPHVEQSALDDTPPLKSRAEIDTLMKQWVADPSWVLEATPGFEAYADELAAFSYGWKDFWHKEGFDVPGDPAPESVVAPCADGCATCFDHRALEYLMSRNPAISTLVQRYAEYDRADAALNQAAQQLQAFTLD